MWGGDYYSCRFHTIFSKYVKINIGWVLHYMEFHCMAFFWIQTEWSNPNTDGPKKCHFCPASFKFRPSPNPDIPFKIEIDTVVVGNVGFILKKPTIIFLNNLFLVEFNLKEKFSGFFEEIFHSGHCYILQLNICE